MDKGQRQQTIIPARRRNKINKWIGGLALVLAMAGAAQASLIGLEGVFANESSTFEYDGKTFQNGWAIQVYESSSSTINFDITLSSLYQTSVSVSSGALPFENYVKISEIEMNLPNNSYIYPVLFDNAVPANSSSYLVLDTEARNVGAYDPQVSYTPGRAIPAAGLIQFNGQTWQAIPEPATLGLLGLGTLVMALRRKPGK